MEPKGGLGSSWADFRDFGGLLEEEDFTLSFDRRKKRDKNGKTF